MIRHMNASYNFFKLKDNTFKQFNFSYFQLILMLGCNIKINFHFYTHEMTHFHPKYSRPAEDARRSIISRCRSQFSDTFQMFVWLQ